MISIVWSKSVDKSNTKYYDVVIKWVNIITSTVSIDKRYTLYRDVAIKWLNVVTLRVNIAKRCILTHYTILYYIYIIFTVVWNSVSAIVVLLFCFAFN